MYVFKKIYDKEEKCVICVWLYSPTDFIYFIFAYVFGYIFPIFDRHKLGEKEINYHCAKLKPESIFHAHGNKL